MKGQSTIYQKTGRRTLVFLVNSELTLFSIYFPDLSGPVKKNQFTIYPTNRQAHPCLLGKW